MICAPLSAAYRIPSATTSSVPSFGEPKMSSHSVLMTLTGINFTLKATPAVPPPCATSPSPLAALFVNWPIVPLTCVPCPLRSTGSVSFQMKSCGATNRVDGWSSVAATNCSVRLPSAGYAVPPLPGGPTFPSESTVNAPAWNCNVAGMNAMPVSTTATVIAEPAAG